ncbi:23S rRNA (uracil(1939)-C(5))-methyltransferase RlmD [Bacillus sp. WMMC1349]|uniref:23S rRNA (uracil(1939)-C(5))-methyltransferase RlmD n=1 Tax=Bacillus sp. WMMC1349 TaxID=2736254 RepID=UPI0015557FCF|nr:23S rRNA (uracil(1939)-C(5))-methyltransferase RlmD [Bacillus sp. WMMC1349]NPC91858.1 23S rRNA (uracil(1939)-C(5))-methyltransferase RlmD [Bacillus sp. WMMC1349]
MKRESNGSAELKVGQQFPLTIKRLGINGEGVGYFKRKVVFVPGALPGEEVVVEATKVHPKFSEGRVKNIRKRSEHRVKPPCTIYEQCGGCQLQHLAYDQQLKEKRDIVMQALERHTRFQVDQLEIRPTIGMENPWHYRNKSQFQLGLKKGKMIAGLYGLDSHHLVPISECIVQHSATNKTTQTVKQILEDFGITVYHERKRTGDVRTIVTRTGFETGEVQVVLVTAKENLPRKQLIAEEIKKRLPEVTSVIQNVNKAKTSVIFGDDTKLLAGSTVIQEVLGDISFELSARAFFQLNPIQTVKLYDEVKKAAQLTGSEKVVDAYCGVGTIGMWIAEGAGEIRGMDVIKESIADAMKNAKKHGIENAHYVTGTAEHWLPKWTNEGFKPDVVIVDPPRTGCDRTFLDTIKQVKPKRFVYVSCNPSTLAKDLQYLAKDYHVKYIQPVDMFPQTAHVECVALMSRVDN